MAGAALVLGVDAALLTGWAIARAVKRHQEKQRNTMAAAYSVEQLDSPSSSPPSSPKSKTASSPPGSPTSKAKEYAHLFDPDKYHHWGVLERVRKVRFHKYYVGILKQYALFFDFETKDLAAAHDLTDFCVSAIKDREFNIFGSRTIDKFKLRAQTDAEAIVWRDMFVVATRFKQKREQVISVLVHPQVIFAQGQQQQAETVTSSLTASPSSVNTGPATGKVVTPKWREELNAQMHQSLRQEEALRWCRMRDLEEAAEQGGVDAKTLLKLRQAYDREVEMTQEQNAIRRKEILLQRLKEEEMERLLRWDPDRTAVVGLKPGVTREEALRLCHLMDLEAAKQAGLDNGGLGKMKLEQERELVKMRAQDGILRQEIEKQAAELLTSLENGQDIVHY